MVSQLPAAAVAQGALSGRCSQHSIYDSRWCSDVAEPGVSIADRRLRADASVMTHGGIANATGPSRMTAAWAAASAHSTAAL